MYKVKPCTSEYFFILTNPFSISWPSRFVYSSKFSFFLQPLGSGPTSCSTHTSVRFQPTPTPRFMRPLFSPMALWASSMAFCYHILISSTQLIAPWLLMVRNFHSFTETPPWSMLRSGLVWYPIWKTKDHYSVHSRSLRAPHGWCSDVHFRRLYMVNTPAVYHFNMYSKISL